MLSESNFISPLINVQYKHLNEKITNAIKIAQTEIIYIEKNNEPIKQLRFVPNGKYNIFL